jgi:cob(II)yrinic acid a,c-diamide reductase
MLVEDQEGTGTPVIADALATFQCRVVEAYDIFTHTVFAAEVVRARLGQDGAPLLHHQSGYVTVEGGLPLAPKPR